MQGRSGMVKWANQIPEGGREKQMPPIKFNLQTSLSSQIQAKEKGQKKYLKIHMLSEKREMLLCRLQSIRKMHPKCSNTNPNQRY